MITAKEARTIAENRTASAIQVSLIEANDAIKGAAQRGACQTSISLPTSSIVDTVVMELAKLNFTAEKKYDNDPRDGGSYYLEISW